MKLRKTLLFGFAFMFLASSAVTLTACGKGASGDVDAQDFYAMAALSSINYLEMQTENVSVQALGQTFADSTMRPNTVTDKDVQDLAQYMAMFEGMLSESSEKYFSHSQVNANDEYYQTYNLKMTFNVPTLSGQRNLTMYYKEIDTNTHQEIDDDEIELEINTTLEGVIVDGDKVYNVAGKREYEKEGKETEVGLEFRTYDSNNPTDYVMIEHEKENNEVEYTYTIYENNREISETQVEFENKRNNKTLELEFESHQGELEYEIIQKSKDNYTVKLKNTQNRKEVEVFTITSTTAGYVFTYSNGFSETI